MGRSAAKGPSSLEAVHVPNYDTKIGKRPADQKSKMLFLADGTGGAPIIVARLFAAIPQVLLLPTPLPGFWICYLQSHSRV